MAFGRLKPGALAAALLLSATAHAAPISAGVVTIDGLRYQLIDLNPDDGIAASVTFADQTWTGRQDYYETPEWAYGPVQMQQTILTGTTNVLDNGGAVLTGASPDGTIQYGIGPGSIALRGTLDSSGAQGQPRTDQYGYSYNTQDESGQWYRHDVSSSSYSLDSKNITGSTVTISDDALTSYGSQFILSAHTALVLMGTAKLELEADRSNLLAMKSDLLSQVDGANAINSRVSGAGYMQVGLSLGGGSIEQGIYNDGTFFGGMASQSNLNLSGSMYYNSLGFTESMAGYFEDEAVIIDDGVTRQRMVSKDFALTFVNASEADMDMLLIADMTVQLSENFYGSVYTSNPDVVTPIDPPPVLPPLPGVPEPGTYALMGLGLAGLLLARRRAHQA